MGLKCFRASLCALRNHEARFFSVFFFWGGVWRQMAEHKDQKQKVSSVQSSENVSWPCSAGHFNPVAEINVGIVHFCKKWICWYWCLLYFSFQFHLVWQCCADGVVWFRHKEQLVRVWKRSWLGAMSLFRWLNVSLKWFWAVVSSLAAVLPSCPLCWPLSALGQ